ncbi:MAG TPA: glycosyltransferase family A protein, partial [Candidatus Methylomirabilis sp.]|nr:glycosyltransferase family A protein [Candidatus Methylomirabilis sp.]
MSLTREQNINSTTSGKSIISIPTVTFVVPCYKLAHYLAECVESILLQSYKNIEVIILDDQSPDNTAEVANIIIAGHPGRTITYVLNNENLGNIRNYNKGINMAGGLYVWILSPDDRLRSRHIVERYVRLMESNSKIGYVFCAAHLISGERDAGIYRPSLYRMKDQILDGKQLVKDIADDNFELIAASVMIRKECYEKVTLFPPDMPHRGDSYVWSLIAMRYDVGYFSKAMVDYRIHNNSMVTTLARENFVRIIEDNIAVPWRIKAEAQKQNLIDLVTHCWYSIIKIYIEGLLGVNIRGNIGSLTMEDFEMSLLKWEPNSSNRSKVRVMLATSLYWTGMADLSLVRINRARKTLHYSFYLQPELRYHPPMRQLMNNPDLGKRFWLN